MENGSPSRRSWADEADEELPSLRSLGAGFLRVCFSDSEDYSHSEPPSPLPPGKGKAVAEPSSAAMDPFTGVSAVDAALAAASPSLALALELARPREGLGEVGFMSPFLTKTYDFVDDPNTDTVVSWGSAGKSFVVHDPYTFAHVILPPNFKHGNFSRFVRELKHYGFRKVDPDRWEFANESFQRGQRWLLKTINCRRRRRPSSPSSSQQRQEPSACLEVGQFGLDGEVHRVQRNKGILLAEVKKLRQEQRAMAACDRRHDVFVCKTCSRQFPSFQALGGHRNSHKRGQARMFSDPAAAAERDRARVFRKVDPDRSGFANEGSQRGQRELLPSTSPSSSQQGNIAGYGTTATATGGGEADLEAGLGGAAPAQQPSVNEKEEAKTLRQLFIQTYAALLPTSAMAYPVLKDAPKHVKIIIFGGLLAIITIVLFAGILSRSLARRRLAFWLVSCSAVALLTFSVAS